MNEKKYLTTIANSRIAALTSAGLSIKNSGGFIRIAARWRGGDGFNVSIDPESGRWTDFVTGEKGDWAALCTKLTIDPGSEPRIDSTEIIAHKQEIAESATRRVEAARKLLDATASDVEAIRAGSIEQQLENAREAHKARLSGHSAGQRLQRRHALLSADAHKGALEYLESRRAIEFAAHAGALIGRGSSKDDENQAPPPAWEIRWPIRKDGSAEIIGVQRETGRGHSGKKMLGRKQGGGLLVHRKGREPGGILAIGEGAMTCRAVWTHFDCWTWIRFDSGNLAALDTSLIKRAIASEIWILADHDRESETHPGQGRAGQRAAQAASEAIKLVRPDLSVKIALPPIEGQDWDDVDHAHTAEEFRAIFTESLRDPEPPKPANGEGESAEIIDLAWHRESDHEPAPDHEAMDAHHADSFLSQIIEHEISEITHREQPRPVLIAATTGLGKSEQAARAIARDGTAPFLIATPRTVDRDAIARRIEQLSGMPPHVHEARNAENCFKIEEVTALFSKKRSPHAWECLTCPHGPADAETPCKYMQSLRASQRARVVVTTHDAIAETSILLKMKQNAGAYDEYKDRALVIDEKIERTKPLSIEADEITLARTLIPAAIIEINSEIDRYHRENGGDDFNILTADHEKETRALEKARDWIEALAIELDALQIKIASIPGDLIKTPQPMSGADFDRLRDLLSKIPRRAIKHDGTIAEDVRLARAARLGIPASWLKSLGLALSDGTAWIQHGKIIGGHASTLWRRALDQGALLLDATPEKRAIAEVEAAGGSVYVLRAKTPNLSITQHGPQLFGRGHLTREEIDRRAKILIARLDNAEPGKIAILTHKPVGLALLEARPNLEKYIGWWGKSEKAHNDWRAVKTLIIHGLPIASGDEAATSYAIDNAAITKAGGAWGKWGGAVKRAAWVKIANKREIRSALPLPDSEDAAKWTLDQISASVAQAIGRLRAVRRPQEALSVEIWGAVPVLGHGIEITDFALATGKLSQRAESIEQIAEAARVIAIDTGKSPTRRMIAAIIAQKAGAHPSNTTIDRVMRAIRKFALASEISLESAAEIVIDGVKEMRGDIVSISLASARLNSGAARLLWLARARLAHAGAIAPEATTPARRAGP